MRKFSQLAELAIGRWKRKLTWVLFFSMITAISETVGISVFVPLLVALSDEASIRSVALLQPYLDIYLPSTELLIMAALVLAAAVNTIKTIVLFFTIKLQSSFVYDLKVGMTSRYLEAYLSSVPDLRREHDYPRIIRDLTTDAHLLVMTYVMPILQIFAEIFLIFFIFAFLLAMNFWSTILFIFLVGASSLLYMFFAKKTLSRMAARRKSSESQRIDLLSIIVTGKTEMFLMKLRAKFFSIFSKANGELGAIEKKYLTITQMPRVVIEYFGLMALIAVTLVMIVSSSNLTYTLTTLAAFAAASFKVLPSLNRLIKGAQSLSYSTNIVNEYLKLSRSERRLCENQRERTGERVTPDKIILKGSVSIDAGRSLEVEKPIELNRFDNVLVCGPSGGGKTTFANNLALHLSITKMQETVEVDFSHLDADGDCTTRVSYVGQQSFYREDVGVGRNIIFEDLTHEQLTARIHSLDLVRRACLDFYEEANVTGQQLTALSGGQRQRIAIARAMAVDSPFMVLDEPTSALDNDTSESVIINLINEDRYVVIVSHSRKLFDKFDCVLRIENGLISRLK